MARSTLANRFDILSFAMKNVYEVLRQKELELCRLAKEVEVLRVVAPLLSEDGEADNDDKPTRLSVVNADDVTRW